MNLRIVWLLAAIVVPLLAVWQAGGEVETSLSLAISPFGSISLLFVQVFMTLPLAFALAVRFGPTGWPFRWAVVGVAVAGLTYYVGDLIGDRIDESGAGFGSRAVGRLGWCLALALPWTIAARVHATVTNGLIVAAAVASVAVPAVTATLIADATAIELTEQLGAQRLRAAARSVEMLVRVGRDSVPAPDGKPAPTAIMRTELRKEIDRLETVAARPLPASAAVRFSRGLTLAQLDRFAEADELLSPLVDSYPGADVALATVRQAAGQFAESDLMFRKTLSTGRSADRRRAYDGLAYNARHRGDYATALSVYQEALAADSNDTGYYYFQIGRTYAEMNRPNDAATAYRAASAADPKGQATACERQLRRLQNEPFGCRLLPDLR